MTFRHATVVRLVTVTFLALCLSSHSRAADEPAKDGESGENSTVSLDNLPVRIVAQKTETIITSLYMYGPTITDRVIESLEVQKKIKTLYLLDSAVTEQGLARFMSTHPDCVVHKEPEPRHLKYATGKIAENDFDKNGVLKKEEWSQSSSYSPEMDLDQDGVLAPREYAIALMVDIGARQVTRKHLDHAAGIMADADSNKDGVLSREEWQTRLIYTDQMDLNRDGKLTRREFSQALTRRRPSQVTEKGSPEIDPRYMKYAVGKIRERDLNKDGVLSKEEWSRSSSFKDNMDLDGDGKITPTEYARALIKPQTPREQKPDSQEIDPRYMKYAVAKIRERDLNKDGVLSKEEWSKSNAFKDNMDLNGDGKITPTEYARALISKK